MKQKYINKKLCGEHESASGFNINKEIINLYYSNIK